jgi:hypothetical protein
MLGPDSRVPTSCLPRGLIITLTKSGIASRNRVRRMTPSRLAHSGHSARYVQALNRVKLLRTGNLLLAFPPSTISSCPLSSPSSTPSRTSLLFALYPSPSRAAQLLRGRSTFSIPSFNLLRCTRHSFSGPATFIFGSAPSLPLFPIHPKNQLPTRLFQRSTAASQAFLLLDSEASFHHSLRLDDDHFLCGYSPFQPTAPDSLAPLSLSFDSLSPTFLPAFLPLSHNDSSRTQYRLELNRHTPCIAQQRYIADAHRAKKSAVDSSKTLRALPTMDMETDPSLSPTASVAQGTPTSSASRRPPRKSTLTQQQKNQKRQRATQDQLITLEVEFNKNPTPTAIVRERIAQDINMTERSVQIWFQNRYVGHN